MIITSFSNRMYMIHRLFYKYRHALKEQETNIHLIKNYAGINMKKKKKAKESTYQILCLP